MEFDVTAGIFHPFAMIKQYMYVLKMKKHEKQAKKG